MKPDGTSMRLYILLILIAVTTAFSAGYLSLSIHQSSLSAHESLNQIDHLKNELQHSSRPTLDLNLAALYPAAESSFFLDPKYLLSQSQTYRFASLASLYRYTATCDSQRIVPEKTDALKKAWLWLRYRCGAITELPEDFFETGPFIFPLGGSYAFLRASQSPGDSDWAQRHLQYMNVSELKALPHLTLDPQYAVLASLAPEVLRSMASNEEWILSQNYVLHRNVNRASPAESISSSPHASGYSAFSRADWDRLLSGSPFSTEPIRSNQLCLLKDGGICWQDNSAALFRSVRLPMLILLFSAVLLAIACVWFAISKFKTQRIEEERKRFALQTLTHELRTPLTSLLLSSEEMLDSFDSLPIVAQSTLLRMSDDIRRLQRLAETSQRYLSSQPGQGLIVFGFKQIDSVHSYLDEILQPFEKKITVQYLDQDREFKLDPYWVAICVKNLVENALRHGRPPVQVTIENSNRKLQITVRDQGSFGAPSSQGLGLGLAIVRRVVESMGADLSFSQNPTCFQLKLEEPA
jgi:signal transduction histidine kinase